MEILKTLDFTCVGQEPEISVRAWALAGLIKDLLSRSSGHVSEMTEAGYVLADEKDKHGLRFLKKIEELGGRILYKTINENYYSCIAIWDHGMAEVSFSQESNHLNITAISEKEEFVRELGAYVRGMVEAPVQKGHIFAIVRYGNNLNISSIGDASIPLEAGNYTPAVMENYKFVVKDLRASSPSGRIVILEGLPGTGKTHLIRALLRDVKDGMFVLISPDMVSSLAGPELLPLLISTKTSYRINGPIILVLEDADRCLVRREGDNINYIQSLLNLGDGILGSLLDLRIVATTNATKLELDAAILRPGRLSRRLEVGSLDENTATGILKRLLPNQEISPTKRNMTLAEVYALARHHGWLPEERNKKASADDEEIDEWDDN